MADSKDMCEAPDAGTFQQSLKLAFELHNAGRHADAAALCRVLLRLDDGDPQLLFLLGMVLHKLGQGSEAVIHLQRATELEPKSARIFNGLGFVQQGLKDYAHAVESYHRAIELGMRSANTYYSLGNALYQLGKVEDAVTAFQNAVKLTPSDVASWNNLGKCLGDLGQLEESICAYDQALALDTNYALARYGRAQVLLTAGRLEEGFREYNQWRHHGLARREFPGTEWRGESILGQTLLLHAEQGFGDAIQHARFIPQVRARVGRIILECRPELKTLFAHSGCADEVVAVGEKIPPYDSFTSLVSLPGILGTTLATIPNQVPYLQTAPGGKLPAAAAGNLKVGLAWAGNPSHHNNALRSLRLEEMGAILKLPGIVFYSLQIVMPPADEEYLRAQSNLVDLRGLTKDFLDTSGLISDLDLVIAADTAVAHLAGALAKPTWTLLPYAADWRWFQNRTDSPWYPTMRLFRQSADKQWSTVTAQAAEELKSKVKTEC